MPGGSPVAMTIEQSAADSAIQNAFERLMMLLRLPTSHQLSFGKEAFDPKALLVRRPASEAAVKGRIRVLQTLHMVLAGPGGHPARERKEPIAGRYESSSTIPAMASSRAMSF